MDTRTQLQNALRGIHVPELARMQLRPVLRGDQQPVIVAGNHALVAQLQRSDGGGRALRIPVSPEAGADWPGRYREIAEGMPSPARDLLPRGIQVAARGITLGRHQVPAVIMEWIDGPTMLHAVDRASRAGRVEVLSALADAVKEFAIAWLESGVTHGDLAADNLMMRRNGDMVAVDLDRLAWNGGPKPGFRNVSPAYRHPSDPGEGRAQDAFALLVQYVSIKALADDPDLRASFGDSSGTHGGALLFSSWDLTDLGRSRVLREVRSRVGASTRALVDSLHGASLGDPELAIEVLTGAPAPAQPEPAPEPADDQATGWDLSRVIERLRTQETAPHPVPPVQEQHHAQQYPDPIERDSPETIAEDRAQLRAAIERGDEAAVVRLASRLADDPIAQFYRLEVERILASGYDGRIARSSTQQHDDTVISLATEAEARHLSLNAASRRAVRRAEERIQVRNRLETALRDDRRPDLAELAVSGELVVLGDTDRGSLQRVLQALEWPILQQALDADDDMLILAAFDDDLFGDAASVPDRVRERVALARTRRTWMANVRATLKARDVDGLVRLFSNAPRGAASRLSATERNRAVRMMEREAALQDLAGAIGTGNDSRMLAALQEVERVGARIEDRQMWASIQRVVERASVVEQIVAAGSADPIDDRALARLLPVARMMGLRHDPALVDALSWDRLNAQVVRAAAARRIRRAIATDDDRVIRRTAFPDPADAIALLSEPERARVAASRKR